MIRKFLNIAALMLGAVAMDSCNMIHESVIDTETVPVTFVVKTVEQTKAIADASNIDILYWQVFDTDVETAAAPMAEGVVRDSDGDGRFTLDLSLILNQTYNFIFWAQDEQPAGAEHYDVTDLRRVGIVTYDDELANDETRAAFYAYEELHITGTLNHEVTLYRPFAQLNLGTSTYDVSSLTNTTPMKVNYSAVTVSGVAEVFNTLSGKGEGRREVCFQMNQTPNGDLDAVTPMLEANNQSYYWLGMNYLIVNDDLDNVAVDMVFYTTHGDVQINVPNVPIKENHRTNIIGDLLTSEVVFDIVLDDLFENPDIIVEN